MASIDARGENKWRIRVYVGRDAGTGKKKYAIETYHGGWREAQRRARQLQTQVEAGGYVEPSRMTLGQYLQHWLENTVELKNVRPRTFKRYREIVTRHLIPNLGNIKLKQLQPSHIEAYYSKALKQGRIDGTGGLSAQTVQHHARVLSQALSHGVNMEELGRNVAQKVKRPKPKRKEVEPLTRDGVSKLLQAAYHTEFYYPLLVAVFTGLRRSEVLGLTWESVNLEERYLTVNKGLHTHSTEEERYQPPKTDKSKRRVSLPNELVLALRHYREMQEAARERLGVSILPGDLFFSRADGSMMHPDSFSKACVRLAKKAGLEGVHLHSLRHTQASMLIEQGEFPKVISERLGHASTAFTNDIYGHLMPGMEQSAAAKVDAALEGVIIAPE